MDADEEGSGDGNKEVNGCMEWEERGKASEKWV